MKNITLNIALFSLVVACTSCNKISENIQQDIIVYDTAYFEIPILNNITSPATITGIPLSLNLEDEAKSGMNKFSVDQVKSTKLKNLNLALGLIGKDSTDIKNNFGNLEYIKFKIVSAGNFGNIANITIPSYNQSRALTLTPVIVPDSLKTILINPVKTYEVTVKAKTITTTPLKVRAAATYTITLAK